MVKAESSLHSTSGWQEEEKSIEEKCQMLSGPHLEMAHIAPTHILLVKNVVTWPYQSAGKTGE